MKIKNVYASNSRRVLLLIDDIALQMVFYVLSSIVPCFSTLAHIYIYTYTYTNTPTFKPPNSRTQKHIKWAFAHSRLYMYMFNKYNAPFFDSNGASSVEHAQRNDNKLNT